LLRHTGGDGARDPDCGVDGGPSGRVGAPDGEHMPGSAGLDCLDDDAGWGGTASEPGHDGDTETRGDQGEQGLVFVGGVRDVQIAWALA
jgi:hypothetical protein